MPALKDSRLLYAICYEQWNPRKKIFVAKILNVHANSAIEARNHFCFIHPNRNTHRIAPNGVAPVVGYMFDEKNENKLYV